MDLIRNDANSTKSTNNIYRQLKNEKRRSRYKNNTNNVSGLQHLSDCAPGGDTSRVIILI